MTAAQAALKKSKTPETMAALDRVMHEQEAIEKNLPDLPTVLSVKEGSKIVPELPYPHPWHPPHPGQASCSWFPSGNAGFKNTRSQVSKGPKRASGVAKWLANSEHPLTSRVIVNRIWTWHFGHGIVGTTDNFGLLGDAPSHPEMLDG